MLLFQHQNKEMDTTRTQVAMFMRCFSCIRIPVCPKGQMELGMTKRGSQDVKRSIRFGQETELTIRPLFSVPPIVQRVQWCIAGEPLEVLTQRRPPGSLAQTGVVVIWMLFPVSQCSNENEMAPGGELFSACSLRLFF